MSVTPHDEHWLRPLGATGLEVSAISIGASPLGSVAHVYGYDVGEDEAVGFVRNVLASPFRVLDTSNNYSRGDSERRIGAAIAAEGGLPEDFLLITKVDGQGGDFSADRVRASLAESRERLGIDYFPLIHLHDPEFFSWEDVTGPGGAIEALVQLKEAGEVGHLGLAGGDVHVMSRYLSLGIFDVLQTHNRYTLVDRSAEELIAQAIEQGVAVANAAVHGGGILARPKGATRYGYTQAPPEVVDAVGSISRLCDRYGVPLSTVALQFSLKDDRLSTTVVGTAKTARLAELLAAAATSVPDDLWAEIEELVPARAHWLDFRDVAS